MDARTSHRTRQSLTCIRIAVATVMIIHGVYRATQEGFVAGFGGFLESQGLPFGVAVAGAITAWEIIGGVLLALGRWTRLLAIGFAVELGGGLLMVHAREGWFVVGGGRNGMEFAAILIVIMLAIAWDGHSASGRGIRLGNR